jgi:hypothetical protein
MRRLTIASTLLTAFCLIGCSANKDFEKDILGHPAPESSGDSGWSNAPPPPPPPGAYSPPPAYAPPQERPVSAAPQPVGTQTQPVGTQAQPAAATPPAGPNYKPKPFTPAPVSPNAPASQPPAASQASPDQQTGQPAGQPAAQPAVAAPAGAAAAAAAAPAPAGSLFDRSLFTFMVGEFAHEDKAKELMKALEGKGFNTRMEPGKIKNRVFYKIFATKEGNRAELEGEMLACGVNEPHLIAERPIGSVKGPSGAGKAAPAAAKVAPAAAKTAPAAPVAQPATSKPSRTYAPPVVEPAPPLPDGYVPPPPKKSGS